METMVEMQIMHYYDEMGEGYMVMTSFNTYKPN